MDGSDEMISIRLVYYFHERMKSIFLCNTKSYDCVHSFASFDNIQSVPTSHPSMKIL